MKRGSEMLHVELGSIVKANRTLNRYLYYADSLILEQGEDTVVNSFVCFLRALETAHNSTGFKALLWAAHRRLDFFDLSRYGEDSLCTRRILRQSAGDISEVLNVPFTTSFHVHCQRFPCSHHLVTFLDRFLRK